ncbi:hypothetical protein KY290_021649 [Solanum tuberosum]|uniref:Uncharacterized protein n=1 Tax=Solanum tuberosum TaxID=4113 RepID=A0ABQ7V250_SOLTU|nr:hypothetical protein KY289_022828 [Solanum tuberosum]KAH0758156.1 hypothetical protein KY290_021649 [Solanum tuberosum]
MASHESSDKKNRETDLAVPRDLSPIVPGIHPRLYQSPAGGERTLGSEEKENVKSTMQQWYLEGVAGPLLSSGMCTKVFQFDASSSAPEAIVPVTNSRDISMELHRNRRILNRPLVSLSRSSHNISEEQIGTNGKNVEDPSISVDTREFLPFFHMCISSIGNKNYGS